MFAAQQPAASWAVEFRELWHSWQFYLAPLYIQKALQPEKESLGGPIRALTLWQHKILQAAIVQAQATLIVLVTAWTSGVAVSEQ